MYVVHAVQHEGTAGVTIADRGCHSNSNQALSTVLGCHKYLSAAHYAQSSDHIEQHSLTVPSGVSDVVNDIIARVASEDQINGGSGSLLLVGPPGVGAMPPCCCCCNFNASCYSYRALCCSFNA